MNATTELIGWKAIAEHLGVSDETARRWAKENGLPVYKVMGSVRADSVAILEWKQKVKRKYGK